MAVINSWRLSICLYEGWSESKFTRCTVSQPKDIHLLWVCNRDLWIIVSNTVCQSTHHLPSIICTSQLNMAIQVEQWSKKKVHAAVWVLNTRNMWVAEIHCQLMEVHGEDVISQWSRAKWCMEVPCGGVSTEDTERSSRPTTARTSDIVAVTENAIYNSRRITVSELQHSLNLSHETLISIIQNVGLNKVCVHWVPWALTEEHKK
jgi:hypothetical protein